jgi:hypothetical protein
MATKTKVSAKLNVQHDYISLKLPTGTFTTSYRGSKASGQLAQMKGAFESLDKYVQTTSKTKTVGESMRDLTNPSLLTKLVPGWDKPIVAYKFIIGDKVEFTTEVFKKKYPGTYEVSVVKGKYNYIKMTNKMGKVEHVGFVGTDIKKVK